MDKNTVINFWTVGKKTIQLETAQLETPETITIKIFVEEVSVL